MVLEFYLLTTARTLFQMIGTFLAPAAKCDGFLLLFLPKLFLKYCGKRSILFRILLEDFWSYLIKSLFIRRYIVRRFQQMQWFRGQAYFIVRLQIALKYEVIPFHFYFRSKFLILLGNKHETLSKKSLIGLPHNILLCRLLETSVHRRAVFQILTLLFCFTL